MAKREDPSEAQHSAHGGNTIDEISDLNPPSYDIVEHLPDMIFVKEAKELRFVQFNRAAEQLLGYAREELLGKNDFDFFPAEEAAAYVEKDREVLREGKLCEIPEEPIHTHQGLRTLRTKKVPIFNEAGEATHLLGISEDITELRQTQNALHATRDELVATRLLAAQKEQLLGNVANPHSPALQEVIENIARDTAELKESLTGQPQLERQLARLSAHVDQAQRLILKGSQRASSVPASEEEELKGLHILFADDEAPMRQVAEIVLARAGAQVELASDGEEAFERFKQSPDAFDLIVLDLSMPHQDGHTTLQAMRALRPEIKVLISTGHGEGDASLSASPHTRFLQKPYRAKQLSAAILGLIHGVDTPA